MKCHKDDLYHHKWEMTRLKCQQARRMDAVLRGTSKNPHKGKEEGKGGQATTQSTYILLISEYLKNTLIHKHVSY